MATTTTEPRKLVTFVIGNEEFCIGIMAVREIRGWTPSTPLPHVPPYVCGVINLRGAVLSIIDLAARLGRPRTLPTSRHVIIVVQIGTQVVGLLVDAVTGILAESSQVLPVPRVASTLSRSFIEGLFALHDRVIGLLALDNILPEHEAAPHGGHVA